MKTRLSGALTAPVWRICLLLGLLLCVSWVQGQSTSQEIQPGQILQASAERFEWARFKVAIPSSLPEPKPDLTVIVTPLGDGDPDLYMAFEEPVDFRAPFTARAFGLDAITLTPAQYANQATAYIGIYAWQTTNFTIVATYDQPVDLEDGVPQSGYVTHESTNHYVFDFSDVANHGAITIAVVPVIGSPLVLVSGSVSPVWGQPTTYDWSTSATDLGEALIIDPSDDKFPAGKKLYIGVYGSTSSQYTLIASSNSSHMQLQDGLAFRDSVPMGQTKYFVYYLMSSDCSLSIAVTTLSGDADLYVSKTNPKPSAQDNDQASARFGDDDVMFDPAQPSPYYIAVSGWSASTFTVLAKAACGANHTSPYTSLTPNMPQSNSVSAGKSKYYKIWVGPDVTAMSLSVTRDYGDPDLYVRPELTGNPEALPGPNNNAFMSASFGPDLMDLDNTMTGWCSNCTWYIAVYGATDTSFTLTASQNDDITMLVEGRALRASLSVHEYAYYQFRVDSNQRELTFTVTDLGRGDPDLFISRTYTHPNKDNRTTYDWSSQRLNSDSVTIPHDHPLACVNCNYYIAVYAYSNTTFTIRASSSQVVNVQDGIPTEADVDRGAMRYFAFRQPTGHGDVTFSLTSNEGQANMYVSTTELPEDQNPNTYQWFSPWYSSAKTIQISESEPNACHNSSCVYYIGIYGISNGTFTLTCVSDAASVALQNGVPVRSHIDKNEWEYFYFSVDSTGYDLSIMLTPITGDPDLYVSTTYRHPNETNADHSSTRYGSDIVDYENAAIATYYIGVKAFTNSTFNIMALMTSHSANDSANVMTLLDGQPQLGNVFHTKYRYYRITIGEGVNDLSFTLSTQFGDPDLYITNDGSFPTTTHFSWSSLTSDIDIVRINSPAAGSYLIAVYGFSTAQYTLTASTTAGVTTLRDGISVRGELEAKKYDYYRFDVDSMFKDLTITVTSFSGDPDIYVTTEAFSNSLMPNQSNYIWSANAFRDDAVTVPHTDGNFTLGTFYIAVYSYSACSYSITASLAGTNELENGQPQQGTVAKEAFAYYIFHPGRMIDELTVSVTPLSGAPNVFVTATNIDSLGKRPVYPTETNSMWHAFSWGSSINLPIHSTDEHFCREDSCVYVIGVYGATATTFSVSVSTSAEMIRLRENIPVTEWVTSNSYEYFYFLHSRGGQDITLTVTALTGDPDIFVSLNSPTHPTSANSTWWSRSSGNDALSIPEAAAGTYYIGIYGYVNTTFILTASVSDPNDDELTVLVMGQPTNGVLPGNRYKYYSLTLTGEHRDLTFSATTRVGDPDLYVNNNGTRPTRGPGNSQWSSAKFGSDIVRIDNPTPGQYIIGVYAYTTTNYTLTASVDSFITILQDGVPYQDLLDRGAYAYFMIPVDRTDKDLTVSVTSFNGDPDLYMSDVYDHPNATHYTWAATSYREDSITLPSRILHTGNYYVSVRAWTNSTFTILASFSSPVQLQDGQMQTGYAATEQGKYYTLSVGPGITDVTFTVTPVVGSAYMYISTRGQPVRGNDSTIDWSATSPFAVQSKIITANDPLFCNNYCTYHVLVYGATSVNYTIVGKTSNVATRLQDGEPAQGWVSSGSYAYFSYRLDMAMADLTITVTPVSAGDPDVYVSTQIERPTSEYGKYTWRSADYGADIVNIDYTDENYEAHATYFIAVYGWTNTTFTITASALDLSDISNHTSAVSLLNGVPQLAFLGTRGTRALYNFAVQNVERDTTISVTPRYGDPDLFVRMDGLEPNSTFWQWSSRNWGQDSVTITNGCSHCVYTIAVEAYTHTLYSIMAITDNSHVQLQDGVAHSGFSERGKYSYFAIQVDRADKLLLVTCTALTGDPDLYISMSIERPTSAAGQWTWRSADYSTDAVLIRNPALGTYYIGVYGYTNTTFLLTANIGHATLLPNTPHDDVVSAGEQRYYRFEMQDTTNSSLVIAVTPNDNGQVLIYASNLPNVTEPNATTAIWSSAEASGGMRNVLTIPSTHPRFCANCVYYITVAADSYHAAYTISASYGTSSQLLVAGQPTVGTVTAKQCQYFRGVVDQLSNDINVDVTTYAGEVQIFAAHNNSRPSASASQWASARQGSARGVQLSILKSDPQFRTGTYYFGVCGMVDSRFTIVFSTVSVMVRPGVPQASSVKYDGSYFFVHHESQSRQPSELVISVKPADTASASAVFEVYVSTHSDNSQPGPDRPGQWHSRLTDGYTLTLSQGSDGFCENCTYYIGIFGRVTFPAQTFTLLVNSRETYTILFDNSEVDDKVALDVPSFYEMYVLEAGNFSITLEPCQGEANLYIAQDSYLPDKDHYMMKSEFTDRVDTLELHSPGITKATFYIGVFGVALPLEFPVISYKIIARTSKDTRVLPQVGSDLSTDTDTSSSIIVSFAPATTTKLNGKLKYTIYYSLKKYNLAMYSVCGAELARGHTDTFTIDDDQLVDGIYSRTVKGLQPDSWYSFGVVVQDADGLKVSYRAREHKTRDIDSDGGAKSSLKYLFIFGIPLVIILGSALIYLIYRNRRLTQELEIEMHDVPKSAVRKAVRGPASELSDEERKANRNSKNYSKLLTDEDDVDDDYAPPELEGLASPHSINETL